MEQKSINAISRGVAVAAIWIAVAFTAIFKGEVVIVSFFAIGATFFVTLFMRD